MSPTNQTRDNLITNISGREFTFMEAISMQDTLDSLPKGKLNHRWVNKRTNNEVIIGSTGGDRELGSNKKKKNKILNPFLQINNKKHFSALSKMHSKKIR